MNPWFNLTDRLKAFKNSLILKGLSRERDFGRRNFKESIGNAHFFIQDVSQHKLPYNHRLGNYPDFKITIVGSEIDNARLILNNLSKHSHNLGDTELISDVVNNLSRKMYYWQKIYYYKTSDVNEPSCLEIWPLGVFRVFGYYLQLIPKVSKPYSSPLLRFESASNVFTFTFFENLLDRFKYSLVLRMLNRDRTGFPIFYSEDKFQNRNFDLKYYKMIETVFLTLITRTYDWKLRYLADDYKNEYYRFYSSYLSAIRDAQDREIILNQINKMLKQFKIDAKINLEGIPTSHDLKNALQEMKEGRKSFSEALKDIYLN
jgi:hypothetical protein